MILIQIEKVKKIVACDDVTLSNFFNELPVAFLKLVSLLKRYLKLWEYKIKYSKAWQRFVYKILILK